MTDDNDDDNAKMIFVHESIVSLNEVLIKIITDVKQLKDDVRELKEWCEEREDKEIVQNKWLTWW
tara:strand:+ start:11004 stop:11198 length:195 start_codon:yes stop_codon:yes gene_type:complete